MSKRERRPLKVVLLGSAPLLVAQGLIESLAGRLEILRLPLLRAGAVLHQDARANCTTPAMPPRWRITWTFSAAGGELELCYRRERYQEVDFVVKAGRRLAAIEFMSGRAPQAHRGTAAFAAAFTPQRSLPTAAGDAGAEPDRAGHRRRVHAPSGARKEGWSN